MTKFSGISGCSLKYIIIDKDAKSDTPIEIDDKRMGGVLSLTKFFFSPCNTTGVIVNYDRYVKSKFDLLSDIV
ncbi:hypothetical protein D3C73_1376870 [compost metagenome]